MGRGSHPHQLGIHSWRNIYGVERMTAEKLEENTQWYYSVEQLHSTSQFNCLE